MLDTHCEIWKGIHKVKIQDLGDVACKFIVKSLFPDTIRSANQKSSNASH